MASLVSLLGVLLEVLAFHHCLFVPAVSTSRTSMIAAVFFCIYDTLKRVLPTPPHLAPVNHMISASIGEVVRGAKIRLFEPIC
jgi:hypothetical protein